MSVRAAEWLGTVSSSRKNTYWNLESGQSQTWVQTQRTHCKQPCRDGLGGPSGRKQDTGQQCVLGVHKASSILGCTNRGVAAGRGKGLSPSALPSQGPIWSTASRGPQLRKDMELLEWVQRRPQRWPEGWRTCLTNRLRKMGLISLEKGLERSHCSITVHTGDWLYTGADSERTRRNGFKIKEGRLTLDIREFFHWEDGEVLELLPGELWVSQLWRCPRPRWGAAQPDLECGIVASNPACSWGFGTQCSLRSLPTQTSMGQCLHFHLAQENFKISETLIRSGCDSKSWALPNWSSLVPLYHTYCSRQAHSELPQHQNSYLE